MARVAALEPKRLADFVAAAFREAGVPAEDAALVAVIDGENGIGQVLTAFAAREAIRRAKAHGIAAVALRNSNHFGAKKIV